MFSVGRCNVSVCFFNKPAFNSSGKSQVVLRKTYESALVLTRTFYSNCPGKEVDVEVYCCLGSDDCWGSGLVAGWL